MNTANIIYEDKYFIAIYKESGIEVDDNLIKLIKKENQKIYLLPCDGLADTIEFGTEKQIKEKVSSLLSKYKNYNIDAIVLGCTHYPYAKKYISEEFPSATLIDGNKGVTKQVVKLLTDNNLLNSTNKKGKIEMIYNK